MAKTFATLQNNVEQLLQDTSNAVWDTTELPLRIEDAILEVSDAQPYVRRVSFYIESRTGTATTDTASALVDATETQFLSTDTNKVILNTQNNTWAIVTAYVSTSQLTLSKDIMVDGDEDYEIYNKGCSNKFQINIEDVTDWIGPADHGVIAVEYPVGERRNWTIEGDILTIDVSSVEDSKVVDPATDTEVLVLFETKQRVSQLTDLAGAIDLTAGYAAGLSTIHVDELQATAGIFAEDTLFTIAGVRGTYRVTADATIVVTEAECDLIIHPALIDAAADGDVVTIIGSTLDSQLERLVVRMAYAKAALSKVINTTTTGGAATVQHFRDELAIIRNDIDRLRSRRAPRTSHDYSRD